MATIQFKKSDEYRLKLAKLEAQLKDQILGEAIFGAAGIVADEIRSTLEQVPTDEGFGTETEKAKGPKKAQKKGLYDSLGIASMQDDGTLAALQERWGLTSDASEDADEGGDAGVDANGTGDGADGAGGDAGAGAGADGGAHA